MSSRKKSAATYSELLSSYSELKGLRDSYEHRLKNISDLLEDKTTEVEIDMEVKSAINKIVEILHQKLKFRIESLVNKILKYIYAEQKIEFQLKVEEKRGRTEFAPVILAEGIERNPEDDEAGGAVDLISLGMRIIFSFLQKKKSRPVFILDEPLKFIGSGEMMERAGQMLKEISELFHIQFIIVTHDEELFSFADRMWRVSYKKKEGSRIERIK